MRIRLGLVLLCSLSAPAQAFDPMAPVVCATRADLVQRLERQYLSQLQGSGLRDRDTVMEIWASDSGAWTLVQAHANGQACIVAMGEAWDMPAPKVGG